MDGQKPLRNAVALFEFQVFFLSSCQVVAALCCFLPHASGPSLMDKEGAVALLHNQTNCHGGGGGERAHSTVSAATQVQASVCCQDSGAGRDHANKNRLQLERKIKLRSSV